MDKDADRLKGFLAATDGAPANQPRRVSSVDDELAAGVDRYLDRAQAVRRRRA